MVKQTFPVKQFSGKLVTNTDKADINPSDAIDLQNLITTRWGSLAIERKQLELNQVKKTNVGSDYWVFIPHFWYRPDGQLVELNIKNASNPRQLTAKYGSDLNLSNSVTAKNFIDTGGLPNSYAVFMPYKNIVRVGGTEDCLPGVLHFDGTNLKIFTEPDDGYGYAVVEPVATIDLMDSDGNKADSSAYGYHEVADMMAQGAGGSFQQDQVIWYGITLTYDGNQESPMEVLNGSVTIAADNNKITHTLFVTGNTGTGNGVNPFDERITAINIYRAIGERSEVSPEDFVLLYSIDATTIVSNGVGLTPDDTAAAASWTVHYELKKITFNDLGNHRYVRYTDRTGFDTFNWGAGANKARQINVKAYCYYDVGDMIKGRLIANCLKRWDDGKWVTPHKEIAVSDSGKPDIIRGFIQLGEKDATPIKAIRKLGEDRIAVFDSNNVYVVNVADIYPESWFLETTYKHSLVSVVSLCEVKNGLAFATQNGLFVLNPVGEIAELTANIRKDWQSQTFTGCIMTYYDRYNSLYIGNLTFGSAGGYVFNLDTGGIARWSDNSHVGYALTFFQDFNGDLVMVTNMMELEGTWVVNQYFDELGESSTAIDAVYQTPHLEFGDASKIKVGKKLYVRYESDSSVTATAYIDESLSGITLGTLAADNDTKVLSIPYQFRTLSLKFEVTGNTGAFELKEYVVEYKEVRSK